MATSRAAHPLNPGPRNRRQLGDRRRVPRYASRGITHIAARHRRASPVCHICQPVLLRKLAEFGGQTRGTTSFDTMTRISAARRDGSRTSTAGSADLLQLERALGHHSAFTAVIGV